MIYGRHNILDPMLLPVYLQRREDLERKISVCVRFLFLFTYINLFIYTTLNGPDTFFISTPSLCVSILLRIEFSSLHPESKL